MRPLLSNLWNLRNQRFRRLRLFQPLFNLPRQRRNLQPHLFQFIALAHVMTFKDSGLAVGIYICRLETGGDVTTQKIVLMKQTEGPEERILPPIRPLADSYRLSIIIF